jgi:hypothetical protein
MLQIARPHPFHGARTLTSLVLSAYLKDGCPP